MKLSLCSKPKAKIRLRHQKSTRQKPEIRHKRSQSKVFRTLHLIASCGEALGTAGAAILQSMLLVRLHDLPASKAKGDYRTDIARMQTLGHLKDLADAMGDVNAYIEAVSLSDRQSASIGDVARRLLDKERALEALEWLDRETDETSRFRWENNDLRIKACEAMGDRDTAQSLRWKFFRDRLSLSHWQAYQRHLSDYDAIDAEELALNHIRNFPVRSVALSTCARLHGKMDHRNHQEIRYGNGL